LDKIEVRDNGCGISKDEAPCIAKCHYTSKLSDISQLDTLQTFGFRGEALSSLCALRYVCHSDPVTVLCCVSLVT